MSKVTKLIATNRAIKTLLDEPQMIGQHRGLLGKWYQAWVHEYVASEKITEGSNHAPTIHKLKKQLLQDIEESITVTVEKTCLAEGWKRGTPMPKDAPRGEEVTVKFYGFRNEAKVDDDPRSVGR